MAQKLVRWVLGRPRASKLGSRKSATAGDAPLSSAVKLPELDTAALVDLFKYCDVYSRCRIRRVYRRWKKTMTMPEVNKISQVDFRLLFVSGKVPVSKPSKSLAKISKRNAEVTVSATVESKPRKNRVIGTCFSPMAGKRSARLDDHKRNGLLGPHVVVLIYQAGHERKEDVVIDLMKTIQSIGMFCSGVQHLVFCNIQGFLFGIMIRKDHFEARPPSTLPTQEHLTVLRSHILLGFSRLIPLRMRVEEWSDDDEPYEDIIRQFLTFSPEHRDWLAQYAKHLSNSYHEDCLTGMSFVRTINYEFESQVDQLPSINLETETFAGDLDPRLLWYLTHFILQENLALPFPLSDYFDCYIPLNVY